MDLKLGAIPLSADILTQSNIGLWAFELDEGMPPRMYADDAMCVLLGIKKTLSPEEVYRVWYDNIDPLHYDEVHAAVDIMTRGVHSEVQYPWHAPDGSIIIVRCGGIRNFQYKKGIRIEGVHRDITSLLHFEKEQIEELQHKSTLLKHENLRVDALTFLAEKEPEPLEFINYFADRLLTLSGCDQVLYKGVDGTVIQKNSPDIKTVPLSVCEKCPYFNPLDKVYDDEIVEIANLHNKEQNIPSKCFVKSSYNYVVKLNGKVQGILALHYINNDHEITNTDRETMKMFAQMLSLALSNIDARINKEKLQNERLAVANNVIETFCKNFTTVCLVDIKSEAYEVLKNDHSTNIYSKSGVNFTKQIKQYIQTEVSPVDRKMLLSKLDYKWINKELSKNGKIELRYRALIKNFPVWHNLSVMKIGSTSEILIGIIEQDFEILLDQVENVINDDYFGIYVVDLALDTVKALRNSKYYHRKVNAECYSKAFMEFTVGLEDDDVEYFSKLCNPHYLQHMLIKDNKREYVYFSYRTKKWTKLTTFVLSRDEKNVPLTISHCFSIVDSLQKQNLDLSINLKKQIEENQEYESQLEEMLSFTNIILNTYISAYYINLYDYTYRVYKQIDEIRYKYPVIENYYESFCKYADSDVAPEDRSRMKKILKPDYLLDALRKEKEISFIFTDISGGKDKKYRFQAIRGADSRHAAIGFSDITSELEVEYRYTNTIMGLSDNCQAVYDADVTTGNYILYSENNDFANSVSVKLEKGEDIFENMLKDIDVVIYKDDRYLFTENFTREKIKKVIKNNTEISYEYRILINKVPQWYKLKIVKSSQHKNHFLVGIFNVNKEREKEIEMQEVVNGLASEFSSLFHVDVQTGLYKIYTLSEKNDVNKIISESKNQYELLIKSYAQNFVHPEDSEKYLKYADLNFIKRTLTNRKSDHTFFRRRFGNQYRWFEQVIVKVQDIDSKVEEFIIYFTDRDKEVREDQENKRQLQEALGMAQSANRAKTTFLNNMSHDIRTPMNAIIGYAGLAASHIDNKEQVQNYLSKIGQASDHLLSLINDVLDMSRIESGKMNIEEKKENLSDIIHTLRDIIQSDINAKQLDFYIDSCDVKDEDIICDKLRLNQVLLNILSNAIKYSVPGGNVSMRIKQTTVNNNYASYEFRIKDNGIGMSEEFLKTVFDPFTRMKSTTVSGIQGTGLGMAITKNIVDMMGGTIEIQSELKKGTEVILHFDFKLQKGTKEIIKIPELKGLSALVVDDDTNTCTSISAMLKDIGMKGEWCTSGKEAVVRAGIAYKEGEPFRVYIIDWLMPDMNGIETARRIRKVIGQDTPIIILTAYDWSDIEEEAKEAGITGFVSKPMFPSDLHRVLNSCLGKCKLEVEKTGDKEKYSLEGKKILLVDDNEYNREIAVEVMEDYKINVKTAGDGKEAYEIIKNANTGDFDLILMDIQMPVMNGYEATQKIRTLGTEVSKIPILAMTANAFEEDKKQALLAGMNEHVPKPIDFEKLKVIMKKFIDKKDQK